jgi:hypothetical protein
MKIDIKEYKNITEWLKDYEHKVFRMWKYKKMFTPYEMEQKFVDESVYESDACEYIIITKIIPISNDDYLLGYILADGYNYSEIIEKSENDKLEWYAKLSNIELAYSESDNTEFTETA